MTATRFQIEPLESMVSVGAVTPHAARLWLRTPRPGRVEVTVEPSRGDGKSMHGWVDVPADNARDNTLSILVPDDLDGSPPLEPLTPYQFRAAMDGGLLIGEGRFETSPADAASAPAKFSIAIASCHQPFTKEGAVADRSLEMLRAARECCARHNVKMLLTVGDQMYADSPGRLSLFSSTFFPQVAPPGRQSLLDCTAEEVRRLYQMRHRLFFAPAAWKELLAQVPCYPILDDHELIDNWGSHPDHQGPRWEAVGRGGRAAYYDYQASRVLGSSEPVPQHFGYSVEYGPIAVHVIDIRSQRRVNGHARLYSDEQYGEFETFLQQHEDKQVLFFVLSVPPVHLPRWAARVAARYTSDGEDFSDRWSTAGHIKDRDRLLKRLHAHQIAHPEQRLVILSGDIHIACAHEIRWRDGTPPLWQFVSSGLTHRDSLLWRLGAELSIRLNWNFVTEDETLSAAVRLVAGKGSPHNPYRTLNIGLIEIETPQPGARPTMRFAIYGQRDGEPVCFFRSKPL